VTAHDDPSAADGEQPRPHPPGAESEVAREAARLRWELARLRSRRAVRAALLLSGAAGARRGGPRDVIATLKGRRVVEDLDVIAPATARRRVPYPHLDVVHLAATPAFDAAAPHRHLTEQDPDALRRQPPDLVVLDEPAALAGWSQQARRDLRAALPAAGAVVAVVTTEADAAEVATWPLELAVCPPDGPRVEGVRTLELPFGVDPLVDNPIGWRRTPQRAAVAFDDGVDASHGLPVVGTVADAGDAGAVVVGDVTSPRGMERVLRLGARGIPVVVPGVTAVPDDLADLVVRAQAGELGRVATELGEDLDARERHSVATRRRVLRDHDQRARFEAVLAELGVPLRAPERISVLLATRRPQLLSEAAAQVAAQDHPDVELVAALHGDGFDGDVERRLPEATGIPTRVVRVGEQAPLGDVLNAALDAATGTLVAKMDDDDLYGTGHLSDLVVALAYSGADVVGRRANEVHLVDRDETVAQDLDRQERWAHHLPGATLLLPADVLRAVRFRRVPRGIDTHLLRSIHAAGGSAYATHRFGFVRRRHGDEHTYARDVEAGHAAPRRGLDRTVLDV
jgi:hypothetical protein